MEISQFKALSRPLKVVLDDGDGNVLGEINFRYLPSAVTKETLPAFIALDDEPLARAQHALLEGHLAMEKEVAEKAKSTAKTKASKTEEEPKPLTVEELDARIDKRRADELQSNLDRIELTAKKLCLLIDPEKGHDLTHDGQRLPVTWQTFADHLPLALIEAVTLSILEKMKDPFDLMKSALGTIGVPAMAPDVGDD